MDLKFDISADELPVFMAEADEQLQILDEGLVQLERENNDAQLLQALFRAAHTLKGSAGMIGHKRMVKLTHALEAAFDGLRKQTLQVSEELIDTCLLTIDALRLLCDEVSQGKMGPVEIDSLVERFAALNSNLTAAQPPLQDSHPQQDRQSAPESGPDAPITIRASISPDSIASAARAFQIILTLQEMGEIASMQPDQSYIETAAPVQELTIQFHPRKPVPENIHAEIRQALSLISEVDQLILSEKPVEKAEPEKPQPERGGMRLGETLIKSGLITEDQLQAALQLQKAQTGPSLLLGQALIKIGAISQEVLDQVITEQQSRKEMSQPNSDAAPQERMRSRGNEKTVRTSVERLDNLMNLVGELITDRNRLNLIRSSLEGRFRGDEQVEALAGTITHIGRITDQLQAEVMGIRMLPISNVFNKFPRLVRDLARKAGKQVELVMRGEDTELDRSVIEEISDPLIHLLRNAVDHGLETPQERLAAGKPERGVILLTARHEQGRIIVTVEDNGRGIDLQTVRAKAVEKGQISSAEAEAMSDDKALDLIFLSGLSTARVVSDVSGRGVGMDIVRNNIERLNGSVVVETWSGRGTQFQIVLPLTLAIVPTLLVRVGSGTYAIPLVTVTETMRVSVGDIQTVSSRPVVLFRDQVLPVIRLSEVFDLHCNGNGHAKMHEYVVIVRSGKSQIGLIVDTLLGEQEVVVKSLSTVIGDLVGISSAAILGDGQVALIIDVQGLFKLAAQNPSSNRK